MKFASFFIVRKISIDVKWKFLNHRTGIKTEWSFIHLATFLRMQDHLSAIYLRNGRYCNTS